MGTQTRYEHAPARWYGWLLHGDEEGLAESEIMDAAAWLAPREADGWTVDDVVQEHVPPGGNHCYILQRELGPCEECGSPYSRDEFTNGKVLCHRCTRREHRRERNRVSAEGRVLPFYVAAIATSRAYGGPEEGGWWYDVTEHREVRRAYDWRQGLMHARELREAHPTCPRGRYSVIGGDDVDVRLFRALSELPEPGPFGRQRYE